MIASKIRQDLRTGAKVSHVSILLVIVILSLLLMLMTSIIMDSSKGNVPSSIVTFTFAINLIFSIVFFCKSIFDRPFSLVQMHWVFYLTMFVVAPYSQYLYHYAAWGYVLSTTDYIETNLILTLWGVVFALCSSGRSCNAAYDLKLFYSSLPQVKKAANTRAIACSLFATVSVVALVGFGNLFSRVTFSTGLDKTAGLIFDKVLRPLPVFGFILSLTRANQVGYKGPTLFLSLVLMLVACFPAGLARYNMACVYGAVLLLSSSVLFEKKGVFPAIFLFAFLIVFPASNCYKGDVFSFSTVFNSLVKALENLPRGFCAVDYDAYSIVARSIKFVNTTRVTYGYQLLGALLFFIPRSVWPLKPEGSGNLIVASQGQTVLNISCPLPAEGIVNFGVIGLILFAALAAFICRRVDYWFLKSNSAARLFYPFSCLLVFFIMRGDLLSSYAYTVGYIISFICLFSSSLGFSAIFPAKTKE